MSIDQGYKVHIPPILPSLAKLLSGLRALLFSSSRKDDEGCCFVCCPSWCGACIQLWKVQPAAYYYATWSHSPLLIRFLYEPQELARNLQPPQSPLTFSWNNCGNNTDPIVIKAITVGPDPIVCLLSCSVSPLISLSPLFFLLTSPWYDHVLLASNVSLQTLILGTIYLLVLSYPSIIMYHPHISSFLIFSHYLAPSLLIRVYEWASPLQPTLDD